MNRLAPVSLSLLLLVALCASPAAPFAAQSPTLADYLARSASELTVREGSLGGPGAELLRREATRSQFIFLGEEHGIAEIPQFAAALWRTLPPLGYRHVALEQGPWVIAQADRYVRFGDAAAMQTYRASLVAHLQYDSDESIAFLAALRPTARGAKSLVVWGLDQEMRAAPLLRRLLALAPNVQTRQAVQATLKRAEAADKLGQSSLLGYAHDIVTLRQAFSTRTTPEAKQLLDLMEMSNRIYENDRQASKELTGFEANRAREDMMKDIFLRNYRAAQRAGELKPRVLLQLGAWHGMRGLSPTSISSLGNFVAEFARGENSQMFNLAVTCGKGGRKSGNKEDAGKELPCGADEAEWAQPLLKAARWQWTLFDLRTLRPAVHAGVIKAPEPLASLVFQYDALLLIAGTTPMHYSDLKSQFTLKR